MKPVHEGHKLLRVPIAGIDGEEPRRLISPRPIEGVLCDWHDFDMREAVLF